MERKREEDKSGRERNKERWGKVGGEENERKKC